MCYQFNSNGKYHPDSSDNKISENEDISYEMMVNEKNYVASFFQQLDKKDSIVILEEFNNYLLSKYNDEELAGFSDEQQNLINQTKSLYFLKGITHKNVWFQIAEFKGKYRILMYYDNLYNIAKGEDL